MRYYRRVAVGGTANQETLALALQSTPEEQRHVVEVWVYESTTTRNNDAILRIYVERERIAEMSIKVALDLASPPTYPHGALRIPLDVTLDIGESLYVGHVSGGTASNTDWVIVYEVVGR
jgi:hypothetical protein